MPSLKPFRGRIARAGNVCGRARLQRETGQVLMLVVLIGAVLLITIPLMVYLSQVGSFHQILSQRRDKSYSILNEGVSYAMTALASSTATWNSARNAQLFPAGFDGITTFTGANGGQFTIKAYNGIPNYQIMIVVGALVGGATRYEEAMISEKLIGVSLPNGITAGTALQAGWETDNGAGNPLNVHWGPISIVGVSTTSSTSSWYVSDPLNTNWYPRLFSTYGIDGQTAGGAPSNNRTPAPSTTTVTDTKSYWAFTSLGVPTTLDDASYKAIALSEKSLPAAGPVAQSNLQCLDGNPDCGYYDATAAGTPAVFDGNAGFTVPSSGTVIYVNGDAKLKNLSLDLFAGGALIVTGNLQLDANGAAPNGGIAPTTNLNLPHTASIEYPLYPASPNTWPCVANWGQTPNAEDTCPINTAIAGPPWLNYRGLLWAEGNMTVNAGNNWILAGAVRVDNNLLISNGGTLTLYYDDTVNHQALPTNLSLEIDSATYMTSPNPPLTNGSNYCSDSTDCATAGQCCSFGQCTTTLNPGLCDQTGTDGATYVSMTPLPAHMAAGQQMWVTVVMKNTGNTIWSPEDLYRLGSQAPQDTGTWGAGREYLPAGARVLPGQSVDFHFLITAPTANGTYNFQMGMVWESIAGKRGGHWFYNSNPGNPGLTPVASVIVP